MAVDPSEQKTVMRPAFDEAEVTNKAQIEKTAMLQVPLPDMLPAERRRPVLLYVMIALVAGGIAGALMYILF